jgi:hypothetical protein
MPQRGCALESFATSSMVEPSADERRFLLQIGDGSIVAVHPRVDELIAVLLDAGLIEAERVMTKQLSCAAKLGIVISEWLEGPTKISMEITLYSRYRQTRMPLAWTPPRHCLSNRAGVS